MAKDKVHDIVKAALEDDGWRVTDEPLKLGPEQGKMEIDIGAEKIIVAEKGIEKIAVEVKSFNQPSVLYTFHEALGNT